MDELDRLIAIDQAKLDAITDEADKIDKAMQAAFSAHAWAYNKMSKAKRNLGIVAGTEEHYVRNYNGEEAIDDKVFYGLLAGVVSGWTGLNYTLSHGSAMNENLAVIPAALQGMFGGIPVTGSLSNFGVGGGAAAGAGEGEGMDNARMRT